jgi:hypothetical protein
MTQTRSFKDDRFWSEGFADINEITQVLLENFPNAINVEKARIAADLAGTDYWVHRLNLRPLSVDMKARAFDPIQEYGEDDLALETWSVIEEEKVGWTRDPNKQTDYVLWYFGGSHRWVLVPFPLLCAVFSQKWNEWALRYRTARQCSGSWHSECVFVPRKEVWDAIYQRFGGQVTTKAPLAVFMP